MFSKGELSNIIQSTQEIYLETNVNNMHNPPTNMDNIFVPLKWQKWQKIFRYSVIFPHSSVIDKDNSQSDWRKDFYNGRNGNYRKRRTSENRVILV